MFYVYEWYNEFTNEIFYVGKGIRQRYKETSRRNKLFKEYIKNNVCNCKIIKYFENEKDAFEFEYKTICELKAKGQCKCNLDNGGKGGCHFVWTSEMREYYSKYNVMKSKNQRERMSLANPMKDSDIARRVGLKHRKPFYIGNTLFNTLNEAVTKYNVSVSAIKYWLKVGHNKTELCYYKNEIPKNYDFNKNNHITNSIKVKYDGKEFNTLKDLAEHLNLKYTTLHKYFKMNKLINGKLIEIIQQGNQ